MANEQPSYYATIPAIVRYDENLCANAKLLYGELTVLSVKYGYTFASNSYFAELYKVHPKTISKWIGQLAEKQYIFLEIEKKYERKIYLIHPDTITKAHPHMKEGGSTKSEKGVERKADRGVERKADHNNTSINNTSIIKVNSQKDNSNMNILYDLCKDIQPFAWKAVWYNRPLEREAINDLLTRKTKEQLTQFLTLYKEHRGADEFMPQIYSPLQLNDKYEQVVAWFKKNKII